MTEAYQDPQTVKGSLVEGTVFEEQIRNMDLGEAPFLISDLLYTGATILYAEAGLGKSTCSQAWEHHIAWGRPFGDWVPQESTRCLVIDLESDERNTGNTSRRITPLGDLETDGKELPDDFQGRIAYKYTWDGRSFLERLENLRLFLLDAADAGNPYGYVRIDTMRLFFGARPRDLNAYEWDNVCVQKLNRLGLELDIAIVLIHHPNKSGEVSGSTGLQGGCTTMMTIERNTENPDECVLKSQKVRVGPPFQYAIVMDDKGVWTFTDAITPTQASLTGIARRIADVLTVWGKLTRKELEEKLPDIPKNTLKGTLVRMKRKQIVTFSFDCWAMTQTEIPQATICHKCKSPIHPDGDDGTGYHATCDPRVTTVPVPAPEEFYGDETAKKASQSAYKAMRDSIGASRMKPLPCLPKEHRTKIPWTNITEKMDGAHKWVREPVFEEGREWGWVTTLDRTGSFPSACSSVPVAPNRIDTQEHHHTMPSKEEREGQAGIFLITPPEWTDDRIGHPLGRTNRTDGEPVWVTSAHLEYLDKLAAKGLIPEVHVWESWTGKRNTSLFERFSAWCRDAYAMEEGDERTARKRAASQAIRALWPKQAASPFHRPDWNAAIRAEASVRHWDRAYKAVDEHGAYLLRIGSTDEVSFWTPEKPEPLWVPEPYKLGRNFGNVKIKAVQPYEEWKEGLRGHGKR